MKKILLTGASGFLGWNICQEWKDSWDITGTFHNHEVNIPGIAFTKVNLTNFKELKKLFSTARPDVVLHAAAIANTTFCERNHHETKKINVEASATIAAMAGDRGIPCIFISSDMVFDGENPPYQENDPVCPINRYGEQKALAEVNMRQYYSETILCRLPLMFGETGPVGKNFLSDMLQAIQEKKKIPLFTDEIRTPLCASAVASGIAIALKHKLKTLHLGGRDSISRYDFGVLLASILDIPLSNFFPTEHRDVALSAPRPKNLTLDTSKALQYGFQSLPIREELKRVVKKN